MVSDALYDLEPTTVIIKTKNRKDDGEGDQVADFTSGDPIEDARVIPTSMKDLKTTPELAGYDENYSVYLFGSVSVTGNDKITYKSNDYEVIKDWDRNDNGDYTKIIIARNKREASTDAGA